MSNGTTTSGQTSSSTTNIDSTSNGTTCQSMPSGQAVSVQRLPSILANITGGGCPMPGGNFVCGVIRACFAHLDQNVAFGIDRLRRHIARGRQRVQLENQLSTTIAALADVQQALTPAASQVIETARVQAEILMQQLRGLKQ